MINYECTEACDFCFQKGIKFGSMMSFEDFKKAIDWLERLELFQKPENRKISLMGGEPTMNPKLKQMLGFLKEKNIKVIIFSNFVFNKKKIDFFDSSVIKGFVGTYNPKSFYRKNEHTLVEENIQELKKRGFEVKLSYNITKNNLDYNYVLDACERHNLKVLRFSTAFPNPDYTNDYLNFEDLKDVGKEVISFVRESVRRNIKLDLDCTIPLCILGDEKNILFFLKNVNAKNLICRSVIDVNPDLSVYYCVPRSKDARVKSILSFNNLKEINEVFDIQNQFERKELFAFPECENCKYLIRGLCQGGCLSLKKRFGITLNNKLKEKIVIGVKTWGGIGDGLLATPAIKALKDKYPKSKIRVMCNENHKEIYKNNPSIDFLSILPDELAIKNIKSQNIFETNYGKLKPSISFDEHATSIIGRMLGVAVKDNNLLIFLTKEEDENAKKQLSKYKNTIIIHITSKCSKNQEWMTEKWEELVKKNSDITFIQLGLKDEPAVKGAVDLRGKTSIREAMALVKNAKGFVGVDSFLAHAAAAFKTSSVVLFGPSNPTIWGYSQNINIYKDLECSPCIDTLGNGVCPYDKKCMRLITVKEVSKSISNIIRR
ncbi:MAG: 4Fe-4S cluster-binding domain-containing protein [Nanoarchaeota archaeon]|nr:4Fe-4S cluster-binding domain-containing protein [Nanoarchaeota archaeon]MBU1269660.1 4Fe-4S cluster-binding domain-containing protein [Nanoarchaeota archaeon]MBU1604083.1 4Fe-4S cluster-binding domain-containing protein [Nanoarchaeota archaeon]MBU2443287.1 4Fe-4S cluster-binding domain-containing protein [Nanoarchaeota archaeon]